MNIVHFFFLILFLCSLGIQATSQTYSFTSNAMIKTYLLHPEALNQVTYLDLRGEPSWCLPQGINLSSNLTAFLQFSGKSPNDFGLWDSCQAIRSNSTLMKISEPNFVNLQMYLRGMVPVRWGICFPKQCTKTITSLLELAASALQTPIVGAQVDNLEPITQERESSIIMIVIASFLLFISLVGAIVEHSSLGEYHKRAPRIANQRELNNLNFQEKMLVEEPQSPGNIQTPKTTRNTNIEVTMQQGSPIEHISNEKQTDPILRKQGCFCKFLVCWSLSNNFKKLVMRQRSPSQLDVLDGVRVLSICWVILGHSWFYMLITQPRNAAQVVIDQTRNFSLTFVLSALFAVDTFFFLSAFLASYLFLKKFPLNKRCMNPGYIFLAYFQRYYRLTFLLAFVMYFSAFVIYPLASGPGRISLYEGNFRNCKSYGWTNILYINNYYPSPQKNCFGWGWYLANDMQMFLVLPWVLFVYKVARLAGILFLAALFIVNLVWTFIISWDNDFNISGLWSDGDYMADFYYLPWVRATPYLVGIAFALLYVNYKDGVAYERKIKKWKQEHPGSDKIEELEDLEKIGIAHRGGGYKMFTAARESSLYAWLYLIFGFAICFVITFIGFDVNRVQGQAWSKTGKGIYNTFARGVFVIGLALALVPLLVGRFPVIRQVMGNDLFAVMAKMTYAVYLVHEALLLTFLQSSKEAIYMNQNEAVVWFFAILILSHLIGGAMTILSDIPFGNLDKYLFFPQKRK